ncbi:MAG: ion transporter [Lachnospiraceae bacterium]|nr:ion transporter [Lachnospiraceae bacterium]
MGQAGKKPGQQLTKYQKLRNRIFDIIEVGYVEDFIGRAYDIFNLAFIVVNLVVSVLLTYSSMTEKYGELLLHIEAVTVAFFAVDLVLRIWTAKCLFPNSSEPVAVLRYVFSFNGLVDIFSCLPYYLPFFFPSGMAAFRIFRVMRIFRIFRLNAYFDSLNVIGAVIKSKARLLMSSVFIILMLMLAGSLCMYSLEHAVQPEAFDNALSGLWWAAATMFTVGYGDIYPITAAGKVIGILITILGVGLVAIPTGIISAGFVEQYEIFKKQSEKAEETDVHFICVPLQGKDIWTDKKIADLQFPKGMMIAAVQRDKEVLVPRGDLILKAGDGIVLGVEGNRKGLNLKLQEIELKEQHEWNGQMIKDLDISRRTYIVSVRRKGKAMIPSGDLELKAGDVLLLYTKKKMNDAREIQL